MSIAKNTRLQTTTQKAKPVEEKKDEEIKKVEEEEVKNETKISSPSEDYQEVQEAAP